MEEEVPEGAGVIPEHCPLVVELAGPELAGFVEVEHDVEPLGACQVDAVLLVVVLVLLHQGAARLRLTAAVWRHSLVHFGAF